MSTLLTNMRNRGRYGLLLIRNLSTRIWVSVTIFAAVLTIGVASYYGWLWPASPPVPPIADLGLTPASPFLAEAEAQQDTASEDQQVPPTAAWDLSPVSSSAQVNEDIVNPFTGTAFAQERAQRFLQQQRAAKEAELEVANYDLKIALKHKEAALVQQDIQQLVNPPRPPAPPHPPAIPRAEVLSISSHAAIVAVKHRRFVVQPGMQLGGWRVFRCDPRGITLTYREEQALLPLSFAQPRMASAQGGRS